MPIANSVIGNSFPEEKRGTALGLVGMIYIENKAKDPVLNIKYFKNKQMLFILIIAFVVGVGMMGMIFIPQLSENILKLKAGNGGYLVTILAISPGIMIGFVVNASKELQPKLMSIFQAGGTMQMKPSGGNMTAFKALQNADVTTIVPLLKKVLAGQLPPQIKPMVIKSIDASSTKIIDTFQSVINTGYTHMYTAAAIISFIRLLATLVFK